MSWLSPYVPILARGLLVTVELTVLASALMFAVAFPLGLMRLSRRALVRHPATAFVEILRGTSAIVQLFWAYYALPLFGIHLSAFLTAVVVIGVNEGSYGSEIVRAGLLSVSAKQREAAIALNLGAITRMTRIILPQALVFMLPPFGNRLIRTLKLTSIASLVTIQDLTFRAQSIRAFSGHTATLFGLLLVVYFLLATLISYGTRFAERSLSVHLYARQGSGLTTTRSGTGRVRSLMH